MKTTMLDYINETPKKMQEKINTSGQWTASICNAWNADSYPSITIVASGSSNNASQAAKFFLETCLAVPVYVVTPFTFEHYQRIDENSMHIFISQSGYSTNTLNAMAKLEDKQIPYHLITNNAEVKDNQRMSVHQLDIGTEFVPFVTKGYTMTVFYLAMFALYAAKDKIKEYYEQIRQVPSLFEKQVSAAAVFFDGHQDILLKAKRVHICGYGANQFVSSEAALKLCETLQVGASAYEIEEFLHGGYLEVEEHHLVLLLCQKAEGYDRAAQLQNHLTELSPFVYSLEGTRELIEELSPLANIAFFQTLVYLMNRQGGNETPSMEQKYIDLELKLKTKTINYYNY